jgi:hypothetical protein
VRSCHFFSGIPFSIADLIGVCETLRDHGVLALSGKSIERSWHIVFANHSLIVSKVIRMIFMNQE